MVTKKKKTPSPGSGKRPSPSAKASGAAKKRPPASSGKGKKAASGPGKRTSRRKGKNVFPAAPVITAFVAGLAMAVVCFFGISAIQDKKPSPLQQKTAQAPKKAILPPVDASRPKPPDDRASGEIERALAELQDLPFEEDTAESLEERVRQVDYAIIQAGRSLPGSHMQMVGEEPRKHDGQAYSFHTIAVLPGPDVNAYLARLKQSLSTWSEGAAVRPLGKNNYAVLAGGVETHRIILYPGATSFPEAASPPGGSDATVKGGADYGQTLGKKRRAPGQPALMVVVIDDLGASKAALTRLLALDYPVTFAFWPSAAATREGAERAHRAGREVIVHMPMEPLGYPKVKPGPGVLLAAMEDRDIERRLLDGLSKVPHATGLNNHMGSRFTQSAEKTGVVLNVLRQRGLFMLDSLTHGRSVFFREAGKYGVRRYQRNIFLDTKETKGHILGQLKKAENIALLTGSSVAIGHPLPATLAALEEWQRTRNREVLLVRLVDLPQ